MNAQEYIFENIGKTIKQKEGMKPFTVPCISEMYTDFYYWDTYFTNFALLYTGNLKQIGNNLDNMKSFVEKLGYIPNSDITQNRSQPPLFARSVYDYYCAEGKDEQIARKYLPAMIAEHAFWMKNRLLPCGLNGYKHSATEEYLIPFCAAIEERVGCGKEECPDKVLQGAHFLAIAESGWDFTPRFASGNNRYAGMDYAPVDLNAILYDAEQIIAELSGDAGDETTREEFTRLARLRGERMKALMSGKDNLLYDYNAAENRVSELCHAGMFAPFAFGLSSDRQAAEKLLERLEGEYGVFACADRGADKYDQWDFPYMWAPFVWFCAEGLIRCGSDGGRRIADKYLKTVERVFAQTGTLWEKYNAQTGTVAKNAEYATPSMLGWTAGVYLYFKNKRR